MKFIAVYGLAFALGWFGMSAILAKPTPSHHVTYTYGVIEICPDWGTFRDHAVYDFDVWCYEV